MCLNTSGSAKEPNRLDSSVRPPGIMLSDGSDKNSITSEPDTLPMLRRMGSRKLGPGLSTDAV